MKTLPLLFLSVACNSHAALLLSDDFSSYTAGNLGGQASTSPNTTGNWTAAGDNFARYSVGSGSLDFSRVNNSTLNAPKFAQIDIANTTATTTGNTEFWAMGTVTTGGLEAAFFSTRLYKDAATTYVGGNFADNIVFGIDGGQAFIATYVDIFANGNTTPPNFVNKTSTTTGVSNTAHTLLVQLVNLGADDAFRLWIDPDLSAGQGALGTPDVEISSGNMVHDTGSILYNSVSSPHPVGTRFSVVTSVVAAPQSGSLDDYRLGTTFADMVVPEPSSALLSVVGMAALCVRRKR